MQSTVSSETLRASHAIEFGRLPGACLGGLPPLALLFAQVDGADQLHLGCKGLRRQHTADASLNAYALLSFRFALGRQHEEIFRTCGVRLLAISG